MSDAGVVSRDQHTRIYTSLIREKRLLDEIDFDLICEKPQLIAFSRKERVRKLSGRKEQ